LLFGAADFKIALLFQTGVFFFTRDIELLLFGIQVFALDLNFGILLDVVPLSAALFDFLCEFGQTFCIERVVRVEVFHAGLVETGQGNRLQLQTVFKQVFGNSSLYLLYEGDTLFV